VEEVRTYDELNRLKLLEYKRLLTVFSKFDYTLDPVGHRKVVTEQNGRKVEYEYDNLYRLISEIITDSVNGNRTVSYGYDAVGNRLTKTDSVAGVTAYVYDGNDRLLREELRQNGVLVGSVEYGYDNNGNTRTRTKKDAAGVVVETVTYNWNQENRLVGVSAPNLSVSYTYDADGVRVSKTVNGVTTEYLVDKNRDYAQVLEESVNDASIASYVYGLDLISQERGNADSYYLVDGLGSTRGLTDASGVVTDTYSYDAFGNLIGVSGGTKNDYLFAGEQFDGGLGQYYLRERYYDSRSGRFARRDTYEGSLSDPITLHKYLYGNANPVNFIDPTGLMSMGELSAADSIRDILTKVYLDIGRNFIEGAAGYLPGGNFIVLTLALIDAYQVIRSLPSFIRAGSEILEAMDNLRLDVKHVAKHLADTPQSLKHIKKGSAHVFPDQATMERVTREVIEKGEYLGFADGFHRYGLKFSQSIGERIGKDGNRIPLYYGELKVSEDGLYHVIPRTQPRSWYE